MAYAFLACLLAGFGVGAWFTHRFDAAEIQALQSAIDQGNAQSALILQTATAQVAEAAAKAQQAKQQLELSHAQSIATVNDYAARLHDSLARRTDAVSRRICPGISASTTDPAYLPAALAGVLQYVDGETTRADAVASYAQSCWQFVSNNCGVKK